MNDVILYEKRDHVGILTFNRPDKLNALSRDVMETLPQVLEEVQTDSDVYVLIITGAGDRAFSVGFDLDGTAVSDRTDEVKLMLESNYRTFLKIWNLRQPTIAAVNGYAVAAGSNVAMLCDVVVASDRAKFGEPELRHFALSPLLLLPWIASNKKRMHYLYFSGDTIGAEEAFQLGMVTKVVPHDRLMDEAFRMANRIAHVAPYAVQSTKESLRRTYEIMGFINALDHHRLIDTTVIGAHGIPEKDHFFDLMAHQGMGAFLEARDGWFKQEEAIYRGHRDSGE